MREKARDGPRSIETPTTREALMDDLARMGEVARDLAACQEEYLRVKGQYSNLLQHAPDAMVFVNQEGKIVLVNAQMERLFGYSAQEVVGKDLDMLIPERYRARHSEGVRAFFANPRIRQMGSELQIYALRKDGTEFPADIALSPLQMEDEILVTAAVRDITDRKEAEKRLQTHYRVQKTISSALRVALEPIPFDKKFEAILDLILSVPSLGLEPKGAVFVAAEELPTLVLMAMRGFDQEHQASCATVPFGKCLCGQAAVQCNVVCTDCVDDAHEIRHERHADHGHYCVPIEVGGKALGVINMYTAPSHRPSPEAEEFLSAAASTLAQVIEGHRAEVESQKLQARLAEASKLTALGRLAENVAHQVRNPLTAIGGFAKRLHDRLPEGTAEKEYAGTVVQEVRRLEGILRSVLTLVAIPTLRKEQHDIHNLLQEALAAYEDPLRDRSIQVSRRYGTIPPVSVDRGQILEVVERIVRNAIEAMPTGGILGVATGHELVKGVKYLVVAVSDTGEGIPAGELDRVFEPFYTSKFGGNEAGMGRPIAKKILEDHGGFVRVESRPGEGSTFRLFFPVSAG
jgi:PAS domain S-box-containing protein